MQYFHQQRLKCSVQEYFHPHYPLTESCCQYIFITDHHFYQKSIVENTIFLLGSTFHPGQGNGLKQSFLTEHILMLDQSWAWELWVSFSSSNVTGHLWLLYTCTLNIFTCTTVHQPFSTLNLLPLKLTVPLMWVNSTRETLSMPNIFHNC